MISINNKYNIEDVLFFGPIINDETLTEDVKKDLTLIFGKYYSVFSVEKIVIEKTKDKVKILYLDKGKTTLLEEDLLTIKDIFLCHLNERFLKESRE